MQAAGRLAEQAAGQLAEQQAAGTGAVAGRTLTPSAQPETYVSGDADFHFVGGVSWRLRLHGAQGRRPQPLHGRSRLESLALALECPGRTLLEPHPHPRFPIRGSADALRLTDKPHKAGFPFPEAHSLRTGVRAARGLSITTTWLLGGLISLTHVCVCELHPHYRSPSITWGSRRDDFSLPRARIGNPILGR